jgi:hypothetical protein
MSFDWDASSKKRRQDPTFYGHLPKSMARCIFCLLVLFYMSTFNLILRTLTCVLLSERSIGVLFSVLGCELLLYLVVKAVKGDMAYWVPVKRCTGAFLAVACRILMKQVVDWTSCAAFRHLKEVGDTYFLFTMLVSIGTGLVTVTTRDDATESRLDQDSIIPLLLASCVGVVFSFAVFLLR